MFPEWGATIQFSLSGFMHHRSIEFSSTNWPFTGNFRTKIKTFFWTSPGMAIGNVITHIWLIRHQTYVAFVWFFARPVFLDIIILCLSSSISLYLLLNPCRFGENLPVCHCPAPSCFSSLFPVYLSVCPSICPSWVFRTQNRLRENNARSREALLYYIYMNEYTYIYDIFSYGYIYIYIFILTFRVLPCRANHFFFICWRRFLQAISGPDGSDSFF